MECYPLGMFVDIESIKGSLLCYKCNKVARKTMITQDNFIYGEDCIPNEKKMNARPMLAFRNIADNLEVLCTNSDNCQWIGKLKTLNEHLASECTYSKHPKIDRPNNSTPKVAQNLAMDQKLDFGIGKNSHPMEFNMKFDTKAPVKIQCSYCEVAIENDLYRNHMENCSYRIVDCPIGCGQQFQLGVLSDHIEDICSEMEIDCPLKGLGCDVRSKRGLMDAHTQTHFIQSPPVTTGQPSEPAENKMKIEELGTSNNEFEFIKNQVFKQNQILETIMASLGKVMEYQQPISSINSRLSTLETQMNQIKNQSSIQLGTGTLFALQEFESKILAQLAQIQQNIGTPNNLKVQSFDEPEFCMEQCPPSIKLLSPKSAVSQGTGTIALMKAKVVPEVKYSFRIKSMADENLGVGFGDRRSIEQNNYEIFENDKTHGCYLITANGYYKRPGVEEWLGVDKMQRLFRQNDLIELVYSAKTAKITLTNINMMNKSFVIDNVKEDLSEFFPFVRVWSKEDSIEIQEDKNANVNFFDRDRCGAAIEMPWLGKCTGLGQGSICILRNSLKPNFSYKFQAIGKQTVNFAIGVCLREIVMTNRFEIYDDANHGCYLFTSDGFRREHLVENFMKPLNKEAIVFGNSETLIMRLDDQSRILNLMAYPSLAQGEIRIPNEIELSALYPCVQLVTKGDQISIL